MYYVQTVRVRVRCPMWPSGVPLWHVCVLWPRAQGALTLGWLVLSSITHGIRGGWEAPGKAGKDTPALDDARPRICNTSHLGVPTQVGVRTARGREAGAAAGKGEDRGTEGWRDRRIQG